MNMQLRATLEALNARAMVVGHTPQVRNRDTWGGDGARHLLRLCGTHSRQQMRGAAKSVQHAHVAALLSPHGHHSAAAPAWPPPSSAAFFSCLPRR